MGEPGAGRRSAMVHGPVGDARLVNVRRDSGRSPSHDTPPRYPGPGPAGRSARDARDSCRGRRAAAAVDQMDAEAGRDSAPSAWHVVSVPFVCSTYGPGVVGGRVNEDSFIVVTATVRGGGRERRDERVSTAPDVRAFE